MSDIISLQNKKNERTLALAEDRRRILNLAPEQALDAITEYPMPVTLVQSFSEEDLSLLIQHIGLDDALPVLALASNAQWEYLIDMETWHQGQPDNLSLTRWLDRLLKADPDRFTHWILNEQRDLFAYYLHRNTQVFIREYEQDPSEVEEDFFSEDQVHYIRLRKFSVNNPKLEAFEVERDTLLTDILKRIAVYDLTIHQSLLLESSAVLAAEAEEELLRLRNVRLAEKGFLPFDEAVGVYQPLSVSDFLKRQPKQNKNSGRLVESYPLIVDPVHISETSNLFIRTLAQIQDEVILQQLQAEFAGLCNQIISADQKPVHEKADLSRIVDKVSGYISLGLEKIEAETSDQDPYRNANLLRTFLLADIFRVGFGCALALKWKADKWRQNAWFVQYELPLGFWGEAWLGVLGGLLIKKPLFFDNYANGQLYREFTSLQDITRTRQTLDQIIAMDQMLSLIPLDLSTVKEGSFLTYTNLLLTLWANQYLGLSRTPHIPQPIDLSQFRTFFEDLWENEMPPRRISGSICENFLSWLTERTQLARYEITERLGPSLEAIFRMIEAELGTVAARDLDPRFILLFLLKQS